MSNRIENDFNLIESDSKILKILLKDRTTQKNIIWATDSYGHMGAQYQIEDTIEEYLLKNGASTLIKPRLEKGLVEQKERTREKAEVFTPTWVVKKQNDVIEDELKNKEFEEYINTKWLEITCGEAPYMVTRYDTVSGEWIPLVERVGFVDRKLQRISADIHNEEDWIKWTIKAYQASFGYEFQGDSLFIARENLLYTFIDYYIEKFKKMPEMKTLENIAIIISYNVFQMDGLKYVIPFSEKAKIKEPDVQLNLFGEPSEEVQLEMLIKEGKNVKIRKWENGKMFEIKDIFGKERGNQDMKFDVVIGNPPYQDEKIGKNRQTQPIYNLFIDEARKISDQSILITPARFLANTGATPKKWNQMMLQDEKLKIIFFEEDSSKIFVNTDIKGGIVITYFNKNKKFEKIDVFIPNEQLSSVYLKVKKDLTLIGNLGEWVYSPDSYRLTDYLFEENPELKTRTDKSHRKSLSSNVFVRYPEIFKKEIDDNSEGYIQIYGRKNRERMYKFIKKKYVEKHPNIDKWKIFVPGANGSGTLGETLSSPVIGLPQVGHNQTFISIGSLETKFEAEALLKYLKTKFGRALLSIMKTTQNNQSKNTWSKIPLQDFTNQSDIDWSKSIAEIDQQLYKKYGLSEEEIDFIETNVKEME